MVALPGTRKKTAPQCLSENIADARRKKLVVLVCPAANDSFDGPRRSNRSHPSVSPLDRTCICTQYLAKSQRSAKVVNVQAPALTQSFAAT